MASIIGKTVGGHTYYYLREVARVGGKPKVVSQKYLGKAADIEAAISGATAMPDAVEHRRFGDVAAVWSMLERLDVAAIVDDVVGQRRADAAASVGTYFALAVANRVAAPCSKLAFSEWWSTTAGDRMIKLASSALDHRRFWDAMDQVSEDQLVEIERRVVTAMVESFGLDCSAGPRQAKAHGPAPGRSRARGVHRLRRAAGQPHLCRQPPRRHPVPRGGGRAGGAVRAPGRV